MVEILVINALWAGTMHLISVAFKQPEPTETPLFDLYKA